MLFDDCKFDMFHRMSTIASPSRSPKTRVPLIPAGTYVAARTSVVHTKSDCARDSASSATNTLPTHVCPMKQTIILIPFILLFCVAHFGGSVLGSLSPPRLFIGSLMLPHSPSFGARAVAAGLSFPLIISLLFAHRPLSSVSTMVTSLCIFVLLSIFGGVKSAEATLSPPPPPPSSQRVRYVTFGVLRTNFWGLDPPQLLAGMMATVQQLNDAGSGANGTTFITSTTANNWKSRANTFVFIEGEGEDDANNSANASDALLVAGELAYRLDVTTIPCGSYETCARLSPALEAQYVAPFIAAMPKFAAVLRPNFLFASRVIDAAREMGNVPVIAPESSRHADYAISEVGSEHKKSADTCPLISNASTSPSPLPLPSPDHVVHLHQHPIGQFDHLFTAMMHTDQCAHTGILSRGGGGGGGTSAADDPTRAAVSATIERIQSAFADGLKPIPPVFDMDSGTDEALEHFIAHEDPRRRCYVVLSDLYSFASAMTRLRAAPKIIGTFDDPKRFSFYGGALMTPSAPPLVVDNSSSPLLTFPPPGSSVSFVHWVPPTVARRFAPYLSAWIARAVTDNNSSTTISSAVLSVLVSLVGRNGSIVGSNGASDIEGSDAAAVCAAAADIEAELRSLPSVHEAANSPRAAEGRVVVLFAAKAARSALAAKAGGTFRWPASAPAAFPASAPDLYIPSSKDDNDNFDEGIGGLGCGGPANVTTNASSMLPPLRAHFMDFFYEEAVTIDGVPFDRLARTCPPAPYAALCRCNSATRVSYLYRFNTSESIPNVSSSSSSSNTSSSVLALPPYADFDDEAEGQRDATSVAFPTTCSYQPSSWAYPVTCLFILPAVLFPLIQASAVIATESLRNAAHEQNFAAARPPRPLRAEIMTIPAGTSTQTALDQSLDRIDPFAVFGSLEGVIFRSKGVLTIFPNLLTAEEEDPPLVPHDGRWSWTNLRLQPSLADYIHSLASYYKDNCGLFTALRVVASTASEALLIQKSFATVGLLVRVGIEIVVSADADEWIRLIDAWARPHSIPIAESNEIHILHAGGAGYYGGASSSSSSSSSGVGANGGNTVVANWPFILASSRLDTGLILSKASAHFASLERGTLGVATNILSATSSPQFPPNKTALTPLSPPITSDGGGRDADIIFCTFRREWWTPAAVALANPRLRQYASNPRYHIVLLGLQLLEAMADGAAYDYGSSAADILFRRSVVTAAETVFGPFYNTTCSDAQIAANERDRICQCMKGVRTVFVLSSRDMYAALPSTRTNRYAFTMTTCGLVYKPYVAPPDYFSGRMGGGGPPLSAAAIAGVSVAAAALLAGLAGAMGLLAWCGARGRRNNRNAPKDATKPFAIVFTDVQSSTSLWARAPAAMSAAVELHHLTLRAVLGANNGYEVKTVGDSFMVAFQSADDAVAFAVGAQLALFEAGGWSDEIEAIYDELAMEGAVDDDDSLEYTNTNAADGNDENVYAMWGVDANTSCSAAVPPPNKMTWSAVDVHNNTNNNIGGGVGGGVSSDGTFSFYPATADPAAAAAYVAAGQSVRSAALAYTAAVHVGSSSGALTPRRQQQIYLCHPQLPQRIAPPFGNDAVVSPQRRASTSLKVAVSPTSFALRAQREAAEGDKEGPSMHAISGTGAGPLDAPLPSPRRLTAAPQAENPNVVPENFVNGDTYTDNMVNAEGQAPSHPGEVSAARAPTPSGADRSALDDSASPLSLRSGADCKKPPVLGDGEEEAATQQPLPAVHVLGSPSRPRAFSLSSAAPAADSSLSHNPAVVTALTAANKPSGFPRGTPRLPPPSVSAAIDRSLWRGLRVRIGVHFGVGEIQKDPVTHGYDYYGTVVNTAARVEGVGHGGQTLVSEEACRALSDVFAAAHGVALDRFHSTTTAQLKSKTMPVALPSVPPGSDTAAHIVLTSLGPQPLRGLEEPLALVQAMPFALQKRLFPPLRLHIEKEAAVGDGGDDGGDGADGFFGRLSSGPPTTDNATTTTGATARQSHSHTVVFPVAGAPVTAAHATVADPVAEPNSIKKGKRAGRLAADANHNHHQHSSANVAPEFARIALAVLKALFRPAPEAFATAAAARLGEAWGLKPLVARYITESETNKKNQKKRQKASKQTSVAAEGGRKPQQQDAPETGVSSVAGDRLFAALASKLCLSVLATGRLSGVAVAITDRAVVALRQGSNRKEISAGVTPTPLPLFGEKDAPLDSLTEVQK